MRIPAGRSALLLMLLAALQACGSSGPGGRGGSTDVAQDRAAIEQLRQRIRDAELAGDASVFGQVAVADVVVMPPGADPITGRDATVAAMQGFFTNFELHIDYAASPVEVHGDMAIDHGTFTQTISAKHAVAQDQAAAPLKGSGSYLWIYRRSPDGQWLQTHAIWNLK